jgi:hypothetical protein
VTFRWVTPVFPCGTVREYQVRVKDYSGNWIKNPSVIGAGVTSWTVPYNFFQGAPLNLPFGAPIDFQIRA